MKPLVTFASLVLATAALPSVTLAEPELYGRANLSFELVDETGDFFTELQSNASRLGIKGDQEVADLRVVYQLEYGVDFDDDETFSQRNIFLGLENEWGRVVAGHFDTPFKMSQGKIDLFNDLRGDIGKTVSTHENRESNSVMYSTPESLGPLKADFAYIASEDAGRSDGTSAAVSYTADALYGAVAVDQDVEGEGTEAIRLTGIYYQGALQLGGLLETADTVNRGSNQAWLVSAAYKLDRWLLKGQVGQSDILEEGGETLSLGSDYLLNDDARVFAFYTTLDADGRPADNYLGAGFELKF